MPMKVNEKKGNNSQCTNYYTDYINSELKLQIGV